MNSENQLQIVPTIPTLREVPIDLLPVDTKKIDALWAEKTFRYAHLFSSKFNSTAYTNDEDLQLWINTAIDLQNELKDIGVSQAHKKILQILGDYDVRIPSSNNQKPKNFDDVMMIISDKQWYQTNQESKRSMIHMITYGIFRRGYNNWAIRAGKEWMQSKNVTYAPEVSNTENADKNKRKKKGFVYTNLVMRATNSIAHRVQKNMLSNHGEFLSVRKKNKDDYSYEAKKFNHFDGYVVKPVDNMLGVMSIEQQHLKAVRESVTLAVRNGVTSENLRELVDSVLQNNQTVVDATNLQTSGTQNGKVIFLNAIIFVMNFSNKL